MRGEQRADAHVEALLNDIGHVALGHAHVDDIGHEDGDDHLEGALDHHKQHADDGILAILAQIPHDALEFMHCAAPPWCLQAACCTRAGWRGRA